MSESNALVPLADTMQLGKVLAASGFFQDARGEAQAVVKVLAGRELGFGPVASMTGINIIQGRVSLSANLMASAVKRSGRYDYAVREMTDDVCDIEFFENRGGERPWRSIGISKFTKSDALRAGTKNMDKFPRNMLFARALSNGVRWYCPDVTGGPVYTPEELGANVNEEGEIVESSARVVEATPEQAQPDNGHDADTEFASIPSASDKPEPQKENGKGVPAQLGPGVLPAFDAAAAEFVKIYPRYKTKDGKPDRFHLLMAAGKCGWKHIDVEHVEEAFAEMGARAEKLEHPQPALVEA